jgi:hypothetical protein
MGGEREILAAGAQADIDDFFHDFFKLRLTSRNFFTFAPE